MFEDYFGFLFRNFVVPFSCFLFGRSVFYALLYWNCLLHNLRVIWFLSLLITTILLLLFVISITASIHFFLLTALVLSHQCILQFIITVGFPCFIFIIYFIIFSYFSFLVPILVLFFLLFFPFPSLFSFLTLYNSSCCILTFDKVYNT